MRRGRQLTDASLLTVAEAVEEIGGRQADVRQWLELHGLVRDVPGLGRRVSWRQVLEVIESGQGPTKQAPPRGRLPRAGILER